MILPLVIGCVVGAALISRGSPRTRVRKFMAIGASSGATYPVEEMPEAGVIVAHGPGCVAVFQRRADGSFSFLRGKGDQQALLALCRDIAPKSLEVKP